MGFTQTLLDLILKPESSLKLIPVINVSIVLLLVVLCFLAYNKIAVVHICVMAFLAIGLLCSVNWFLMEFKKVKAEQAKAGEITENSADGAEGKLKSS